MVVKRILAQRLLTFAAYITASHETNPVPFVPTYLRDEALQWWRSFGSDELPVNATMDQFQSVFLEKFVKPADCIKARNELRTLKQGSQTVEAFAAKFVRTRHRIQVGEPVDKSTQTQIFSDGLNGNIKRVLTTTTPCITLTC